MRFFFRVLYDAFMRFSQDDGWAIASHVALSILTSLFPFLIFVTAVCAENLIRVGGARESAILVA